MTDVHDIQIQTLKIRKYRNIKNIELQARNGQEGFIITQATKYSLFFY